MIKLNGTPINVTLFPDGTSQVWQLPEELLEQGIASNITWKFENEAEVMHLAQLVDLLHANKYHPSLFLPYLPYARQDKSIANNTTFALFSFAEFLNSLELSEVVIFDPHSERALELIKNSRAIYPKLQVEKAIKETKAEVVIFPDNGAMVKYGKYLALDIPSIYGYKVRDQKTGAIDRYDLVNAYLVKDKRVLIVDDICDFGNTFVVLAGELKKAKAKHIDLYVSHGLFTGGRQRLHDAGIRQIFTYEY